MLIATELGIILFLACGVLVPQTEIKPMPPAIEAQSLKHWTPREIPQSIF